MKRLAMVICALAWAGQLWGQGGGEHVFLSGGPALRSHEELRTPTERHDRWWGNFVRPARMRMQEIRAQDPAADITWLVYKDGYVRRQAESGEPLVAWVESVRDAVGVRLVWVDSGDQVIAYLNRGRDRRRLPVVTFEFFGHSNKHCFMLDYSNRVHGACRAWLHEDELGKIDRRAFAPRARIRSWGCHTGESMSAKWRAAVGVPMEGAIGKTDYTVLSRGELPVVMGRWTR